MGYYPKSTLKQRQVKDIIILDLSKLHSLNGSSNSEVAVIFIASLTESSYPKGIIRQYGAYVKKAITNLNIY